MSAGLKVSHVSKSFGGIKAVNDCNLEVEAGSVTGLIGPNGAGKTTLFNMVAGTFAPTSGQIFLGDEDITGIPSYKLFSKGLLRTFQIAHEFSNMTAMENLMMVPGDQPGENLLHAWFSPSMVRDREAEIKARANEVIDFLAIDHIRNELAGNLSGGQKKLLELGRTMMIDAKTVLLDEVAAGVNRTLLSSLTDNIQRMNKELGYTFFVIEHDMDMIAKLCDPVIVMAQGTVMTKGHITDIRNNPEVIEAYFGSPPDHAPPAQTSAPQEVTK